MMQKLTHTCLLINTLILCRVRQILSSLSYIFMFANKNIENASTRCLALYSEWNLNRFNNWELFVGGSRRVIVAHACRKLSLSLSPVESNETCVHESRQSSTNACIRRSSSSSRKHFSIYSISQQLSSRSGRGITRVFVFIFVSSRILSKSAALVCEKEKRTKYTFSKKQSSRVRAHLWLLGSFKVFA